MALYISPSAALKLLERPCIYHIQKDELYELDEEAFSFLKSFATGMAGDGDPDFIRYCIEEGLLTSEGPVRHPEPVQSPVPSLRYLELQITGRCNLRCRHCYIGDGNSADMSVETIGSVLKEFEELQGLRLLITGGEPLMHRDFDRINEMLPGFFFRKALLTNGIMLTDSLLKVLNVDEIQISMDGMEKAHDSVRGQGAFDKAVNAVRRSKAAGFDVSVSTMVHAENLGDFDSMDRLFRELGVREWTVDVPCLAGRLIDNRQLALPPEEAGRHLNYGFGAGPHGGEEGFGCGYHLMSVSSDGRASKCTFYKDRAVGMVGEGLRNCWEHIRPVRLDELLCDCEHINSCRGGCRFRAECLGNPLGRDLFKCAQYDIIGYRKQRA